MTALMKLTDKLREMSRFNAEVPKWVYPVIDAEITYCEDCKWYGDYYCRFHEKITRADGFCDKGRRN